MKQISKKQSQINRGLARIKSQLPRVCKICGGLGFDLCHLLPRSLHPEYVTEHRNLVMMCRTCHKLHDDDKSFRSEQAGLIEQVRTFAKETEIYRYYSK